MLFGLPRYRQVAEAYITGIEARLAQGKYVQHVASVASFFVSRIDALVDPLLEKIIAQGGDGANLRKTGARTSCHRQRQNSLSNLQGDLRQHRFKKLAGQGARAQRLLWASTGTKNPDYSDVKYVEALIGADTVDTAPVETLNAYRDHGAPEDRLGQDTGDADWVLQQLPVRH